jgi:glycosyltransferase involved in cell wall biosynthesis
MKKKVYIYFFIFIYLFIKKYKVKILDKKKNNELNIFEKDNKIATIKIYNEFNEPSLTSLKDNDLILYYKLFLSKYLLNNKNKIHKNPLISVIVPVYNGEKILIRSLLSIESQSFEDFEIIYVDDCSKDNSTKLIKEFQKIDERIRLFINKKNRGTLYTKSFGVTQAKGKYILIIDQDDIYIDKNLFKQIYNKGIQNDLDIIQFRYNNYFLENEYFSFGGFGRNHNFDKIIIQPELGDIQFYLNESLYKSFFLWDKLIKKETYLKALNYLGEEQWGKNMVHREDHLITFALYKVAQKYMKIKLFGYSHLIYEGQESTDFFNIVKGKSISLEKTEKMLSYQFEFIKFIYNKTKYDKKEKNIAIRELIKIVGNLNFAKKIEDINIKNFVINICNIYLKCIFLSDENKKILIFFLKKFYYLNFKKIYKFFLIKNFFIFL